MSEEFWVGLPNRKTSDATEVFDSTSRVGILLVNNLGYCSHTTRYTQGGD